MEIKLKKELESLATPKKWEDISTQFSLRVAKKIKNENVYEFFHSVDNDLEVVPKPIVVSVNPVHSFVPYHVHNYVEMIIPIEGRCTVCLGKDDVEIKQGEILIIGPYTAHRNYEITEQDLVVNIALKSNAFSTTELDFMRQRGQLTNLSSLFFFTPIDSQEEQERYMIFNAQNESKIHSIIEDIIEEYYYPDNQSNQIIRFDLLSLFSRLVRLSDKNHQSVTKHSKQENHLLPFLLYIEKNYATATLEDMGEEFGFNASYLSTYLKKYTGKSFIKLVHLQRINVAADFLRYSQAPIEQIATKVGYENPSYFYKIFKKTMGVSPAEYRAKD